MKLLNKMEERCGRKVQYLIALSVCVPSLTIGISSGWATPVLPKFHANETVLEIDKHEIAWMLSMGSPGFMVGSIATGIIMDRVGRRATLLWSAVPYGIGMIIVNTALIPWLLCITQFIWQFGTGMLCIAMMLYLSEISDKDIRGTLSLITRIATNLGSLLIMCVGPFLSYDILNRAILVLPLMNLAACWWIPESPYHYLKDGKVDLARKSLAKLRVYKDPKRQNEDLLQMQEHVKKEMKRSGSPKELFTGKQYRKAIIIAAGLKVTQIMTGIGTIKQYLGLIMQESAIPLRVETVIIIFGAIQFFVSVMPSLLADRVGRRPLLIYSYFGTSLSLATVGLYFFLMDVVHVDKNKLSYYGGYITFGAIILANIISTIGFNSIVGLVPGEIFPMNVKASAMASLSVFSGLLGFVVGISYQALKDIIGLTGVFWLYAAIAFSGAVFSILLVPETKGKSLKEIQSFLQGQLYNNEEAASKFNCVESGAVDEGFEVKELEVLNKKV